MIARTCSGARFLCGHFNDLAADFAPALEDLLDVRRPGSGCATWKEDNRCSKVKKPAAISSMAMVPSVAIDGAWVGLLMRSFIVVRTRCRFREN